MHAWILPRERGNLRICSNLENTNPRQRQIQDVRGSQQKLGSNLKLAQAANTVICNKKTPHKQTKTNKKQ